MLEIPLAPADPMRQAEELIERLKREQRPRPLKERLKNEGEPSKVLSED
jgi:hypothetical protein